MARKPFVLTSDDHEYIKEAKRKQSAPVTEQQQRKRCKSRLSNANEKKFEGAPPPSLEMPSSKEKVKENHAPKEAQPANDKNVPPSIIRAAFQRGKS